MDFKKKKNGKFTTNKFNYNFKLMSAFLNILNQENFINFLSVNIT